MDCQFSGIYRGKNVLLTGHTGFKGSWLAYWLTRLGANVTGYSLAPPTAPNHFETLKPAVTSHIGDIADLPLLAQRMREARPDIVFHLAAQPLVRRSYADPVETYRANVLGTLHVCEAARACGTVRALVAVTTDKVYENRECRRGYREDDRLGGHDPYSSSKACAEILLSSYRRSFCGPGSSPMHIASARAGNVLGGGDWSDDRLIPDIMKAAAAGAPAPIRNPGSTRPWQHVLECLGGYLLLGARLLGDDPPAAYAFNFGPDGSDALAVGDVAKMAAALWPAVTLRYPELAGQPHEAGLLTLDCSLAAKLLGWKPVWNVETALRHTVGWYRAFYESGRVRTADDLDAYVADAAAASQPWAGA